MAEWDMDAEVTCPNCRAANPEGTAYCRLCGTALSAGPPTGPATQGLPPALLQPRPTQNYPPPQPTAPYGAAGYSATQPPQTPAPTQPYSQPTQPYPPYPTPAQGYGPPSQPHNPYAQPPYYQPPAYGAPPPPAQYPTAPYWQQPYPTGGYYTAPCATPVARRSKGLLWLLFTSATLLGWAIGLPLGVWLFEVVMRLITNQGTNIIDEWLLLGLYGLIIGAIVGLVSGIFQWLALRLYGLRSGAWALVSTLGWAIGFSIAVPLSTWLVQQLLANQGTSESGLLFSLIIAAILGIVGGLFSGMFQFPALGGQARR